MKVFNVFIISSLSQTNSHSVCGDHGETYGLSAFKERSLSCCLSWGQILGSNESPSQLLTLWEPQAVLPCHDFTSVWPVTFKDKRSFSVLKWQIVICKQIGSHQINLIFRAFSLKFLLWSQGLLEVFLAWYKLLKICDWLTLYHVWVNIHLKKKVDNVVTSVME